MSTTTEILERIARDELGFETLETRGRDRLDFHEVSAAGLRRALLAAYNAGRVSADAPVVVVEARRGAGVPIPPPPVSGRPRRGRR